MTRITITLAAAKNTPQWAESFAEAQSVELDSWTMFSLGCRHGEEATSLTDALAPPTTFDLDLLTSIAFDAGRLDLLRRCPLHLRAYLEGFETGLSQRPAGSAPMWAQTCQNCGIRHASMCTATASGFDHLCVLCSATGRKVMAKPNGHMIMQVAAQGALGSEAVANPGYTWLVDKVLAKEGWGRDWLDATHTTEAAIDMLPGLINQLWWAQRKA